MQIWVLTWLLKTESPRAIFDPQSLPQQQKLSLDSPSWLCMKEKQKRIPFWDIEIEGRSLVCVLKSQHGVFDILCPHIK